MEQKRDNKNYFLEDWAIVYRKRTNSERIGPKPGNEDAPYYERGVVPFLG